METLIYNDPLLEPYSIQDNRKFGEIFCDIDGVFTYRCYFCPNLTKYISDVEDHLLTHFRDIFQLKSKTNQITSVNIGPVLVESAKEIGGDDNGLISPFKNIKLSTRQTSIESQLCKWKTKHRKDLKQHIKVHSSTIIKSEHNDYLVSTEIERKSVKERFSIQHKDDEKIATATSKSKRKKSTKPIINCRLCDRKFHCQTYLDKHIENHSFYPIIFECDICGKRVKERKDFIEHIKRAHIGIKYPCKVCGKEFAQSSYVLIHMRMHNQDRGHQCAVCGKTFFTSGALTSHMRKHNNTMNELPCNICGKIFHLPGSLADHVRVHTGEKPFKCELCPHWFRTKKFLNQHKSVHLEVKQFACEICGMKFKQASGKRVHKRKVHGKLIGAGKHSLTTN